MGEVIKFEWAVCITETKIMILSHKFFSTISVFTDQFHSEEGVRQQSILAVQKRDASNEKCNMYFIGEYLAEFGVESDIEF